MLFSYEVRTLSRSNATCRPTAPLIKRLLSALLHVQTSSNRVVINRRLSQQMVIDTDAATPRRDVLPNDGIKHDSRHLFERDLVKRSSRNMNDARAAGGAAAPAPDPPPAAGPRRRLYERTRAIFSFVNMFPAVRPRYESELKKHCGLQPARTRPSL